MNPDGDLGFRFSCYCKKGAIITATQQKALVTSVGGWPGNLVNGREVPQVLGRWEEFQVEGYGGGWGKEALGSLFLFSFTQPRKAAKSRGKEIRLNSDVKCNSWVTLTLIFKPDGGLGSVSGLSLEANQDKLLPVIHLLV